MGFSCNFSLEPTNWFPREWVVKIWHKNDIAGNPQYWVKDRYHQFQWIIILSPRNFKSDGHSRNYLGFGTSLYPQFQIHPQDVIEPLIYSGGSYNLPMILTLLTCLMDKPDFFWVGCSFYGSNEKYMERWWKMSPSVAAKLKPSSLLRSILIRNTLWAESLRTQTVSVGLARDASLRSASFALATHCKSMVFLHPRMFGSLYRICISNLYNLWFKIGRRPGTQQIPSASGV